MPLIRKTPYEPVDQQPVTFLRREINVETSFRPATETLEPLLGKKNIC